MLRSYLLIAFRNIRRHKLYSLINISCLAIGIAVCMMILVYVLHEHRYDRFHRHADRIFAVNTFVSVGGNGHLVKGADYPAGPLAQQADANVEHYVRAFNAMDVFIKKTDGRGENLAGTKPFLFADSNFFSFFSFTLIRGAAGQVLQPPNSVVLTQRAAIRCFGSTDIIGRQLLYHDSIVLQVTGVAANPPSNSSIDFDFVAALPALARMEEQKWLFNETSMGAGNLLTWLLLKDPGPAGASHVAGTMQKLSLLNGDAAKDSFPLTPLTQVHLLANFGEYPNTRYLGIFPFVALLILLLALVNYMSLATARTITRAKEVGVRKTMGAGRSKIAWQFYVESALYALVSFGAGLIGFFLLKPWFYRLLQMDIDTAFIFSPLNVTVFAALLLLIIVGAGSYPALVLSAFNPVAVLYGRVVAARNTTAIRKGFVVFQFTISAGLVICCIVILHQLQFMRHTETGMDRENIVRVNIPNMQTHYAAFKKEVESIAGVRQTAASQYAIYQVNYSMLVPAHDQRPGFSANLMHVDDHFISMMGLKWKYPPGGTIDMTLDGRVVLNEAAVAQFGLAGNPVGQRVTLDAYFGKPYVAGVVRDFNHKSLHDKIGPLVMFNTKQDARSWDAGCQLLVKIGPHTYLPALLAAIKKAYDGYGLDAPFSYEFMDEEFNELYTAEDRLASLFNVFTGITIFIACLGLFALATFSAQQRAREIGIRKVLGASVSGIVSLLSIDFLKPVLLALVIATPLSWWAMSQWLQDFAYRISIGWWVFILTGSLVLLVAMGTVFFQSWKAARSNPADNLRTE